MAGHMCHVTYEGKGHVGASSNSNLSTQNNY